MVSSPHRTSPGLWVPKILTERLKKRRRAKRAVPGKLKGKKVHGVALEVLQFNQKGLRTSVAGGEPAEQQDISSAFVRCLDSPHQKSQRTDLGLSSSIKASLAKHVCKQYCIAYKHIA